MGNLLSILASRNLVRGITIATALCCFDVTAKDATRLTTPFYFGRYVLEAPTNGLNIWSSYEVVNESIKFVNSGNKHDLEALTAATIAKINNRHTAGYKDAYDQTVSLEGGGAVVVSKGRKYNFYIYYLTKQNSVYLQKVESIPFNAYKDAINRAKELNTLLHDRAPSQRPPANTFAIEEGYMDLPINKFDERVSIGLPVSSIPGIHLTFDTQVIGRPEPGLIARYEQQTSGGMLPFLKNMLAGPTVLRKSRKAVAGLMFDELLLKSRSGGKNVYAFRLEYPGTPESSLEPYTVLELSTVDSGPGFKNDEQALQFWDRLTSSLKRL